MTEPQLDATNSVDVERLERQLNAAIEQLDRDWTVPANLTNNAEYHNLERERLWGRSWSFLGHESEIPKAGDYVVRYIGDSQFIVTRDEFGNIRAHFNSCRHRGMMLCRSEMGNASHYRCPYHGWTYNNQGALVGVPASQDTYGGHLQRSNWGLLSAPQVDVYNGLIFGCLDPDTMPLPEFLGDTKYYMDLIFGRTEGGMEVTGPPQRWIVDANWKTGVDNFVGDSYHLLTTHRALIDIGYFSDNPKFAMFGEQIALKNGHGLGFLNAPPGVELPPYLGLPEEVTSQMLRRLAPEQTAILRNVLVSHGNIFPNCSFLDLNIPKDLNSPPCSVLALRSWRPLGKDKVELWSWCLVEREAPDWFKELSNETYVKTLGSGGFIEHDDVENWRCQTHVLGGLFARNQQLNYQMGRGLRDIDTDWPGPGEAYSTEYAEAASRSFYSFYMKLLASRSNPMRSSAKGAEPSDLAKVTP